VSGLCQQPWFQSRVAEILSEHSLSVLELFRAETVHCLQVLIEIMDDPDTGENLVWKSGVRDW
jgi:hypothetical protein